MNSDKKHISNIQAKFNGTTREFEAGVSILDAARNLGIEIPTLCHDERLKPCGACRMCLVEVKGSAQLVASCMNKLKDGMEIETHSAKTEESRKMDLRMLARKYPREEFLKYPEKPFHRLARKYGLDENDFGSEANGRITDDSHAYIKVDMARCIDCFACVRICEELQGQFVWQIGSRGQNTRIIWDRGASFAESSCVSCGACADVCPTGALEDNSVMENGFPEKWTKTVYPYCGAGTRGSRTS